MFSLGCCRGFATGGVMGFTGDEMVLNEEKCEECLSGSMGVLEMGALTSFQVADNKEGKNLLEETRMCRDPV
ncbi:hypothetical protein ACFX12_006512 [Malus domestica]